MPHRAFTIEEVAEYLHLSRANVERLVRQNAIPFETLGSRIVFPCRQIRSWASQRILNLPPAALDDYHRRASAAPQAPAPQAPLLSTLLTPERITPAITPRTKPSAIRELVELADRTGLVCDREQLLQGVLEREALCSTALDGGVALLHPRHHDPYLFVESFVVLGRALRPIHAGAHDGQPTDLFFLICCHQDALHLLTLARLCAVCHATPLPERLRAAAAAHEMFDAIRDAEQTLLRR